MLLAASRFYEFFSDTGRLAVTLAMVVPIIIVGCMVYGKLATKRMEYDLKRKLAERGYGVEDIERIVNAGRDDPSI